LPKVELGSALERGFTILLGLSQSLAPMLLKTERLLVRLHMVLRSYLGWSEQIYVSDRIAEYRNMWQAVAEAERADFKVLAEDIWEIELNGNQTRIRNDIMEFDNPVTLEIAGRKPLVYNLLHERGLRVPPHLVFRYDELDKAGSFLKQYPAGCVIKPAHGTSSGQGVTTHILSQREVRKASILASHYCKELIIEPMIPGECYRLLVLNGKVIHAVCRRGYQLKGDGFSTISELIRRENEKLSGKGLPIFDIDRDCLFTLSYQNLSLNSTPGKDMEFIGKSVNDPTRKYIEVRTVYNTPVTGRICSALIENALEAAKIMRSKFVGVDFITVDASKPLEESGGVINEVNTTPGLHHHYDIKSEKYPVIARDILKALLDQIDQ
jgi:D-alanine-D-alanine ligase-like ATP-grasp enzyme